MEEYGETFEHREFADSCSVEEYGCEYKSHCQERFVPGLNDISGVADRDECCNLLCADFRKVSNTRYYLMV